MLIPIENLRLSLEKVLNEKAEQGHDTTGLSERLTAAGESYDAMVVLAADLTGLPMRRGWKYVEPEAWDGIEAELDPTRPRGQIRPIDPADAARRVESAFIGSVCGCMLGKPVEVHATLDELQAACEPLGQWPIRDYVTGAVLDRLGRRHESWKETIRENIRYAAADDDINYTVIGMNLLEWYGPEFTPDQLRRTWQLNLPLRWTFGPERNFLTSVGLRLIKSDDDWSTQTFSDVKTINPGAELCGAMIRADAYGYAFPGNPAHAAELAWRDASVTHCRTGVYGAMFAAAAIATAFVAKDRREITETALQFVPQSSRFYDKVRDMADVVDASKDWLDAYRQINAKYGQYGHCRIYQETGTLINAVRFADDSEGDGVGDGFCKQVMQGNDTDSYAATIGSILGAFFGPGHLSRHWTDRLDDRIHTTVATLHETKLSVLATRIGRLAAIGGQVDKLSHDKHL